MTACIYVIATMDTKGEEARWVAERVRCAGQAALTVDVSASEQVDGLADVKRSCVLTAGNLGAEQLSADRGEAVGQMSACLSEYLVAEYAAGSVAGVIGLGGSGGTSLISAAVRRLPIGLPKLIVSTVASGNTSAYIDCSDLVLFPSVVDVAGLNPVSMDVLQNAAHALVGMVERRSKITSVKPLLGLTMFGVTTPCVMAVRQELEKDGWECLIFHAVGTGGRAMERLVESGRIVGVLDLTTTEVADYLAGGIFPATADRFDVFAKHDVPLVLSFGALDMVNFGPRASVPEKYADRQFHQHNAQITLMRTTAGENEAAAKFIASKLNRAAGPVRVLVPAGGVSKLDAVGAPFWNPAIDKALFDKFASEFKCDSRHQLSVLPQNINDPSFSQAVVDHFREIASPAIPRPVVAEIHLQ
jgi:uncharacterized protein (UPF0261 family)